MNLKTTNVLLIEDDPDYAELVEQWLSAGSNEEQYRLRWADTLAQGSAALDAGPVDVILLDLGLPDSDGWQTFEVLRDRVQGIPVIVLSGADSEALALRTIQAGAEDYLVKNSCNRELLVRSVRHSIVRHRSQLGRRDGSGAKLNRVIGILGVKGGVGGTTVACNLADALALESGEKVLLADLD